MTRAELDESATRSVSQHKAAPEQPGDLDPDELLTAPQVAKLLGLKSVITVHNYAKRPGGYFPAPDHVEESDQGRLRRYWKRSTITTFQEGRRGGNSQPNEKVTAPRPPQQWQEVGEDESVTSGEAASILGYADTGSFTSAYGQGNLTGIGEPVGTGATGATKSPSRLWSKRQVMREAEARWLRARHLQERRRLCEENLLSDHPVSAAKLHAAHPDLGTKEQWRSALNATRLAAARGKNAEVG